MEVYGMDRDEILSELRKLKPLTMDQIARIRETAIQDVLGRIGPEPELKSYLTRISLRNLMEPLDYLLVVFLLSLLILSVAHIFIFGGHLVASSYEPRPPQLLEGTTAIQPIWFDLVTVALITQIGLLVMAESGSLGFAIRNAKANIRREQLLGRELKFVERYLRLDFIVAVLCAALAIIENVYALTYKNYNDPNQAFFYAMGWIVGILVPLLVIFLGDHFANLFLKLDAARQEALELFYVDVHNWREWRQNPETFDLDDGINSYRAFFSQRLVEYYRTNIVPRLKDPQTGERLDFQWSPEVERYLAARERVNMRRMDDIEAIEDFFDQGAGESTQETSGSLPAPSSN